MNTVYNEILNKMVGNGKNKCFCVKCEENSFPLYFINNLPQNKKKKFKLKNKKALF
jgi:hypothetical protein